LVSDEVYITLGIVHADLNPAHFTQVHFGYSHVVGIISLTVDYTSQLQ